KMKTDSKITIRVNSLELDEIDDFLARSSDYKNRSDLIRAATMKFLKMQEKERSIELNETVVSLNPRTMSILENLVELKFFSSVNEALNHILIKATTERYIPKIVHELLSSQGELNREFEEFKQNDQSYKTEKSYKKGDTK
ncbi:MAG: ribbon-helix-helix domain-containing protein, partial [Thermoplasmata archaeon]